MIQCENKSAINARQKRVLCVVRWPVGGIRTYFHYNYPTLIEAGYRFTIVGPADESFRMFAEEVRSWDGTEFCEAPVRGRACPFWPTLRRLISSGRFSLIHSHGLTAAVHAIVANRGHGIPHIVTHHDVIRPSQFAGLKGRVGRMILSTLLARATVVINETHDAEENLISYFPSIKRRGCHFVNYLPGIDIDRFTRDPVDSSFTLRSELRLGPETFLLGFLGRFMEQKGFLPLLDAIEILLREGLPTSFHLLVVGSGDFEASYKHQVSARGLSPLVSFHPFTPNIVPILHQIDALVMPSLWESAGVLAMEAMVAGVPLVASDCIGLREVVRDTPAIVARAGDPSSLSDALREVVGNTPRVQAREFIPRARERFDSRRSASVLNNVFDSCLYGTKMHPG